MMCDFTLEQAANGHFLKLEFDISMFLQIIFGSQAG